MSEDEEWKRAVTIDPDDMDGEFARLSGDLAYWSERHAQACRAHWLAEFETKRQRAQMALGLRSASATSGTKMTESGIQERLDASNNWQALKAAEIATEYEKIRLAGVVRAITAKGDMLVSLGANKRSEINNTDRHINED